jgi:ABC-type transport system involved in multi-copper enzyme maturation permease subunit
MGPVFLDEWRIASRRWQLYALRALFVALVGVGLTIVWWTKVRGAALSIHELASAGEAFFFALVGTELGLVLLAAPAYTAGAVCQDRARGALLHLLATDLSNAEIVLGKLAARLLPVLGLVLASVPVLFATVLLGGIDPEAALGATLVTVGAAVLGCTLTLTLSVWGRTPSEVLLAAYLVVTLLILPGTTWSLLAAQGLAVAPPAWVELSNPFVLAFLPYLRPGTSALAGQAVFLGVALAASAAVALVAVLRVRAVTLGQAAAPGQVRRIRAARLRLAWLLPGPSLDGNPVLWREWYFRRPSCGGRVVWGVYAALAVGFSLLALAMAPGGGGRIWQLRLLAAFINGFQVSIGLLLLCVGTVTSLAEERARGSIDVLLATPLPARNIVWGKWCGVYGRVPLLALLPAAVAAATSDRPGWLPGGLVAGAVLAYGAAVTSLGLAVATWVPWLRRAVVLSVAVYALVTAGWFCFVLATMSPSWGSPGLAAASPFYGVMLPILIPEDSVEWTLTWTVVYAAAAGLLLLATLGTFDRCLGRVPQRHFPGRP